MKRSKSLASLSREHHAALVLAKRAQRISADDIEATHQFMVGAIEAFERELQPHFQVEENTLLPPLEKAGKVHCVRRTLAEHEELQRLANRLKARDASSLRRFGEALEAHVRFEERELFPLAESILTHDELAILEACGETT